MIEGTSDITMSAGAPPTMSAAAAQGAMGKEDFLKLLVAQLSQQDPLNPQDGAEFVAQLAQFSSVEQLVNINGGMESLALAQQASTSAQTVGFIGREVVAVGDACAMGPAGGAVDFTLSGAAKTVEVDIVDEAGETVSTVKLDRRFDAGESSAWVTPLDDDGQPIEAGNYRFRVRATDDDGDSVAATTLTRGTVTGVTYEAGYPELMLSNGRRLALADVIRVEREDEGAQPSGDTDTARDAAAAGAGAGAAAGPVDTDAAYGGEAATVPIDVPVSPTAPPTAGDAPAAGERFVGPEFQSYLQRMMQRAGR